MMAAAAARMGTIGNSVPGWAILKRKELHDGTTQGPDSPRRAVRARSHFPNDEAALKLLLLVLNSAEKEWKCLPVNARQPRLRWPSCSTTGSQRL